MTEVNKPKPSREVSVAVRRSLIQKLNEKGITDSRVLEALDRIPREQFVESALVNLAYRDQPLPIGYKQTISQPYIVAYMTQALLKGREINKVLEIGTGSGYQTAVLAQIIPRVFTIERIRMLSLKARDRLKALGYNNIHFRCADGCRGWQEFAPYDAIIITAAAEQVPSFLLKQLTPHGKMIVPINDDQGSQDLMLVSPQAKTYTSRNLGKVVFVPLIEEERPV